MYADGYHFAVELRVCVAASSYAVEIESFGVLEGMDEDGFDSPLGNCESLARVKSHAREFVEYAPQRLHDGFIVRRQSS